MDAASWLRESFRPLLDAHDSIARTSIARTAAAQLGAGFERPGVEALPAAAVVEQDR